MFGTNVLHFRYIAIGLNGYKDKYTDDFLDLLDLL
jgi:hypothetical protein